MNAVITAESRRKAVVAKDRRDFERDSQLLFNIFPGIPKTDADRIMRYNFKKSSGRIGRKTLIDEDEKFDIAVTAHIRHEHTDVRLTFLSSIHAQHSA